MDEMTPEQLFNQFMEQQQKMAKATPQGIPGNKPNASLTGDPLTTNEQTLLNSLRVNPGSPPAQVSSHLPSCPQCGQLHPPLQPGEKCPLAKEVFKDEKGQNINVDVNKYLVDLKNIVVSQIQSKGIKDPNKLFKQLTVEVMKFLEGYKE